jgi:hypothetical protein
MPADPTIIVSGYVSDLPFHPPATDDKRDAELAFDRLDKKIAGGVTRVTTLEAGLTTANASISTNETNIATNATNVATNTTNIATNTTNIATNVTNIATNASNLASEVSTINTALDGKVNETAMSFVNVPNSASTGNASTGWGISASGSTYNLDVADWSASNFDNFFNAQFSYIHINIITLQNKINQIVTQING